MRYMYEPFVLRRASEGRIAYVNPKMTFEFFIQCFQAEQPFFLVSQFEDGRIALTPNTMYFPWNLAQGWHGFSDLLPNEIEYVTMKNGTYPLIITAHPVTNLEDWSRKFERFVNQFAKQSLWEFVSSTSDFQPIEFEGKGRSIKGRTPVAETMAR